MSHWAAQYIGKSWAMGQSGPEAYDCWNFVRKIQLDHYDLTTPEISYGHTWRDAARSLAVNPERSNWINVDSPADGDCVLMSRSSIPVHIGIWIESKDSRGVLHCQQGSGVVFQSTSRLQVCGWGKLQYFRHVSKCNQI